MFDLSQRHFGRFTRTAAENTAALAEAGAALAEARDDDATVEAEISLGEALTVAGREREARAVLLPAVDQARRSAAPYVLGWALLTLATAEHYADLPADAGPHFEEALRIARNELDEEFEHYCLHHLGRFLVDQGERAAGRRASRRPSAIVEDPRPYEGEDLPRSGHIGFVYGVAFAGTVRGGVRGGDEPVGRPRGGARPVGGDPNVSRVDGA